MERMVARKTWHENIEILDWIRLWSTEEQGDDCDFC
jgi:hypothetical protein